MTQALQRTLQQIGEQLRGLSMTSRILIGCLVVIMIMTLLLVGSYAGRTELVPLGLKANLSAEDRAEAIEYLEASSIPFKTRGNDVLVPAEQKFAILANLTDGEVITPDQIDFDTLVAQDSPFLSRSQNERRWLVATMNVLSRTISRLNGIERAVVVIDEPRSPGGIGRAHIPPSASVNVVSRNGALSQGQVDAIAEMVAGAHAELTARQVAVIDARAGRVHRARAHDAINATTNLELQRATERQVRSKIIDALAYVPGVNVAVNVLVDTREELQRINTYEDPKSTVSAEETYTANSVNQRGGGEPGVRPNTGLELPTAGGRSSTSDEERSRSKLDNRFPTTERSVRDPKGYATQINATIGVPKSYFVRLYRDQQGDETAEPDWATLQTLAGAETDRIRKQIEPLVDTGAADGAVAGTIAVSMIPDFAVSMVGMSGGTGGAAPGDFGGGGGGGGGGMESLVRYVGLGGLALLSLAMMLMMVRKATVREELPSAEELVGIPPALSAAESDLVGEAEETSPALEGLEIDEDQLRQAQMLEQINDSAKETPSEAAHLLRKWIKTEM